MTKPKPVPPLTIATDPQANERYNALIESTLDAHIAAGRRICQWILDNGGEVPFMCVREDEPPS